MFEILEMAGKVAGLGGLVVGVFLLIFREVIRKEIFSGMTKEQSYKIVRLMLVLTWSVAVIGMLLWAVNSYVYEKNITESDELDIVIMDSTLRDVVYDKDAWLVGRTNADEITEILDDIQNLKLTKETTSLNWNREDQVLKMNPRLIVIHASCFYDKTFVEDADRKFFSFLHYMNKSDIIFIIYSRGFHHGYTDWKKKLINDVPLLKGRVHVLEFQPHDTFKNASVRRKLKTLVKEVLEI